MRDKFQLFLVIIVVGLIANFLNLFPNWHAWKNTPEGYVFSGQASWFDPWDINVYVSAVKSGQHRGFFLENLYDSTSNKAIFYYPVYTTLGLLFPQLNPFLLFHLLSIVTSIVFISTLTLLVSRFFQKKLVVFLTVLSIVVAGGLGWLVFPNIESLDTHMTSVSFLSALQRPHEAIALSAYITFLFAFYFSIKTKSNQWRTIAILSLILTLIFYPYYFLSFILICMTYYFLSKKADKGNLFFLILLAFVGFLTVAAMYYDLSLNSSFSGVSGQTLTKPTIISLLLAYSVLLIPYLQKLFKIRRLSQFKLYLIIWITFNLLLSFLPLGFSRFYLRGTYLPLVIIAVTSLDTWSRKNFTKQYPKVFIIFLAYLTAFLSITSLRIFSARVTEIHKENDWYYLSRENYELLEIMKRELPAQSSILSEYYLGNFIPAYTNHQVYFGHLFQTPNADKRKILLTQFFQESIEEEQAVEFLQEAEIDYVIYGSREKELNNLKNELSYSFLSEVYSNQEVILYKFSKN